MPAHSTLAAITEQTLGPGTNADLIRVITGSHPEQLRIQLDAAVAQAEESALARRRGGVLVTRHSGGQFTVAITPRVPFGTTLEHDAWDRSHEPRQSRGLR